ncbi:MAG: hypothetical protein HYZ14_09285 [Bacteroidetes bacterium]|nr:hypothetical protein [Bacteroidota bacterium]
MRQLTFLVPLFLTLGCTGTSEPGAAEPAEKAEPTTNPILGNWNMDSSVFINDGIRGTVSAPLISTTWTFGEDGSYNVVNSVTMPGTFSNTTDSLFVVLMGVPNDYEILMLTAEKLQLRSTILENDSVSMKTDAYLTRITE